MSDGSIDGLAERLDLSRRLIDAEDRTFPHARLKPSVNLASQGPRLGLTRRGARAQILPAMPRRARRRRIRPGVEP